MANLRLAWFVFEMYWLLWRHKRLSFNHDRAVVLSKNRHGPRAGTGFSPAPDVNLGLGALTGDLG